MNGSSAKGVGKILLLLLLATVAAGIWKWLRAPAPGSAPNILLILVDDMGYSDLACYGGEIATPRLDALASGGLRYTRMYNTGRCWPTRAALLSGFYAQELRRDLFVSYPKASIGPRPSWAKLLPEYLRDAGYRSYHSGKWHVDGSPMEGGFDRAYWLNDSDRHLSVTKHSLDGKALEPLGPGEGFYSTEAIAARSIEFLREHVEKHPDRPFFQYVAFTAPHFPLQAPSAERDLEAETYMEGWESVRARRVERMRELGIFQGEASEPERDLGPPFSFPDSLAILGSNEVARTPPWESLSLEQKGFQAEKMQIHAAMIRGMDRAVGLLCDELRRLECFENTLIIFLSDNGASAEIMVRGEGHDPAADAGSAESYLCLGPGWSSCSNTPFRRHKVWVHEGGIATPLIMHWPQGIAARGELRQQVGHVIDLVPTLMDLLRGAGFRVTRPGGFSGKSLAPSLAGGRALPRELWWSHEGNQALRQGDWKLVRSRGEPWELYRLDRDGAETQNLAAEDPGQLLKLRKRWESLERSFLARSRKP